MDVRGALQECSKTQQGLATAADLRAAGVTRSALSRARADGDVTRIHRGVYACAPLPEWPEFVVGRQGVADAFLQRVRAVLLSMGDAAAACGATAACLRGWGLLREPMREIDVAVPNGRKRSKLAGVRALQRRTPRRESLQVHPAHDPVWVTDAVTTVLDCIRHMGLQEAVVVCDSALRSGQVTLAELAQAARRLRGMRHATRVRRALALCDPRSGSVLESALRVELVEAGITGFDTQRVVRDAHGRHILRVDFCFEAHRLIVEADGARWHPDPSRDRKIDNRLVAAGWRVLRLTWSEVMHDPAAVLELVGAAIAAGSTYVHLPVLEARRAA